MVGYERKRTAPAESKQVEGSSRGNNSKRQKISHSGTNQIQDQGTVDERLGLVTSTENRLSRSTASPTVLSLDQESFSQTAEEVGGLSTNTEGEELLSTVNIAALQPASTFPSSGPISTQTDQYFTIELPHKIIPWPYKFPQATGQYSKTTACPVKWEAFPDLSEADIRAYVGRAPWQSTTNTFNRIAEQESRDYGKISEEGVRKRFKKVNLAVFEATGVFFINSFLGLHGYNLPTDTDMKKMMKDSEEVSKAPKPKPRQSVKNAKQSTADFVHLGSNTPQSRQTVEGEDTPLSPLGAHGEDEFEDEESDRIEEIPAEDGEPSEKVAVVVDMFNDYDLLYFGSVQSIKLGPLDQPNCAVRLIPISNLGKDCELRRKAALPFSAAAFDLWYTSMCFGLRTTLPRRLYKLTQFDRVTTHEDQGLVSFTTPMIVEAYSVSQLAGTTEVSDMLLDKLFEILKKDHQTVTKFRSGRIWSHVDGDVMSFFDLAPGDIKELWTYTQEDDPIRQLMSDIYIHSADDPVLPGQAHCISDEIDADDEHADLIAFKTRDEEIASFMEAITTAKFCQVYHNHNYIWGGQCYRGEHPDELPIQFIDKALEPSNRERRVAHGGLNLKVLDETAGDHFDIDQLYGQNPTWQWDRIRAVQTYIITPADGRQVRELRPSYFDDTERDVNGRYGSHPGFNDPDWEHPLVQSARSGYEQELKDLQPPAGARNIRRRENTIFFELEDDQWIPPLEFDDSQLTDHNDRECQEHRRLLWKKAGNKIPLATYKLWRPFEVQGEDGEMRAPDYATDTFKDLPRRP